MVNAELDAERVPRFRPDRLRRALQARHLTVAEAATKAGVGRTTMHKALRGEMLRWDAAERITAMLRATPERRDELEAELFGDEE